MSEQSLSARERAAQNWNVASVDVAPATPDIRRPRNYRRIAQVGAAACGFLLVGSLGAAKLSSNDSFDPNNYRPAKVTLHEGDNPQGIVQCVEGSLAPLGSPQYDSIAKIVSKEDLGIGAQVTLPDLHARKVAGEGNSAIAVDCPQAPHQ